MVFESEHHCRSRWAAICSVAEKLGPTAETVRKWVHRSEIDSGGRAGITTDDRQRLMDLERENRELQSEQDLEIRVGFLRDRARRPAEVIAYIDAHRDRFGAEPIRTAL
jgi:transposase-like protein